MVKKYLIISIHVLIACNNLSANFKKHISEVRFDQISTNNGLSQSSVTSINQDCDGFIWFGTYSGLNRYDGYSFKLFQHDPLDSTTISNNYIRSICRDSSGLLWVGTQGGGLNKYIPETEEFIRYMHIPGDKSSLAHDFVNNLFLDTQGILWISTWGGGLDKLETSKALSSESKTESYSFKHYKHNPTNSNSLGSNLVTRIAEGPNRMLYIGSYNGFSKLDIERDIVKTYYHEPSNPTSISSNNVSSVCVDDAGNIWVGTWDEGLNLYDPENKSFIRFPIRTNDNSALGHNMIMNIYADRNGVIWIGTWGGGLIEMIIPEILNSQKIDSSNFRNIRFFQHKSNKLDPYSLSGNDIYSIFQDKSGILWFGTDWHGVSKYDPNRNRSQHYYSIPNDPDGLQEDVVLSLCTDDDLLWIGTLNGLNSFNRKTGKFKYYKNDPDDNNSLSNNNVRSVHKDTKGNIWIGSFGGLNKYNPKEDNFERYASPELTSNYFPVFTIYEDISGLLWLGSYANGLFSFNPETKEFSRYMSNEDDPNTIGDNTIRAITEDKEGILWVGTDNGGLCRYNKTKDNFTRIRNNFDDSTSISDNRIQAILCDSRGTLWVGGSIGLNKLISSEDKENKYHFKRITQKDGLSSNHVSGIIEDNKGELWITTNYGINRYSPESGRIKTLENSDGIVSKEFSIGAILFDSKTSELIFGGVDGFHVFLPHEQIINLVPPEINIVNLRVSNKDVLIGEKIGGRVLLENSITHTKKLILTHKENVFGFEFSALHFSSPEDNSYAFKLEGFDKDWNYLGQQRFANYTNIKPGKYTFMVKGANSDELWNDSPTTIQVIIRPPWWNTLAFKLIAGTALVLLIISIYRLRISLLEKQKKMLSSLVIDRTEELSNLNELMVERQAEISRQNKELWQHRTNLEKLVEERTCELISAKNRAEESDRLKSAFLANMSHEIRTPMNAIIGFSSLLNDKGIKVSERENYVSVIQNNGEILLTLINDIIDISMIEANQLKLHRDYFDACSILKELLSFYKLKKSKKVELKLSMPPKKKKVILFNDAIRFRQVITNLLNNALKFTQAGNIEFGFKDEKDFMKFYVKDTGIGISKEEAKKVFGYFHKVDEENTELHRGTGIGLSISKKLVELMDGEIWLNSTKGKGSSFYFTLPAKIELKQKLKKADKLAKELTTDLADISILVADDVENNYTLIKNILKSTKASLFWAKNGNEAVDYITEYKDTKNILVLMDIKMPGMGGVEATLLIKEMKKEIPVIAVTAFAQSTDRESYIKNGFDEYLPKPINPTDFYRILSKQVKKLSR